MSIRLNNILHPNKDNQIECTLYKTFNDLLNSLHNDNVRYYTAISTDMQCLGYRFLHMLSKSSICGTLESAYNTLKTKWGIASSDDLKQLIEQYATKMKAAGYNHIHTVKRPSKKSSKFVDTSKKAVSASKLSIKPIKHRQSIKNAKRAIVCRGMNGNYGYRIYEISGPMTSTKADKDTMLNELKMQFHHDTGCPYYEVRPVLYSTWVRLSPEKQIGTK